MKGKIQVILVLLLFAGAILGIGALTYSNRVQEIDTQLVKTVKLDRIPVQTQKVAPQSLTENLVATGVLGAEQDVVLSAEVGAQVKKVTKSLGDACKKGEVIVKLDEESFRLALEQAKASLSQAEVNAKYAEREWQRMEKLKESDVASASQIDSVEGSFKANKAAADTARTAVALAARNLRETVIRCPFSGFVAERMVDPGATVSPGAPLARLVDTRRLTLTLSVTSDKLTRLRVGQTAVLSDPSLPGRRYKGAVIRLGVAADPQTRTFPAEVAVDENETGLHAGQVVQATLALKTYDDVIAVPQAAVQHKGGAPYVMTVENGRAKTATVELGPKIERDVIVNSGLDVNAEVVVVGVEELKEGTEVEVTGKLSPRAGDEVKTAEAFADPDTALPTEKP